MSEGFLNGLYIIPILAVLILVHEIGHFASARSVGVKVEEFGIGIPPRAVGWRRNGVIWSLNWIPFGGFVRVLGEDGKNMDPGSMNTKSPLQRAFFLVAGSAMNFLLAIVLMMVVVGIHGRPLPTANVFVASVESGSPAEAAGLLPGDRLVRLGEVSIDSGDDVRPVTTSAAGQPLPIQVERDGRLIDTSVTPRDVVGPDQGPIGIGLNAEPLFERVPLIEVLPYGLSETWSLSVAMLGGVYDLITGAAPLDQVAGPIGMGQITSEAVATSTLPLWVTLARLSILLSINLGVLNLLPLPALDGGRLLFVLIELLRGGRRIAPEREGLVHFAGLVLLLGLMFVIAFFDVGRLLDGDTFLP
ncbi:MAG: site-2 protease family protein [Chloroflexota bacterium]|nr:site-2 protease family protein [Chloroflexota bacterium]